MADFDISFIIPAYNAEKYISKAINAILSIKNKKIECVVVDDGSTDGTYAVVEQLCRMQASVRLIHKSNGGVSSARNEGIQHASGRFVCFVDADDVIEPSFFGELDLNELNCVNVCMFSYCEIWENGTQNIFHPNIAGASAKDVAVRLLDCRFSKNHISHYMGGKVYQYLIEKKFLLDNDITFTVGMNFAEDMIFCLRLFANKPKVMCVDKTGYYYYVLPNTASHKYRKLFWEEHQQILNEVCAIQEQYYVFEIEEFNVIFNRLYLSYLKDILCHNARYLHKHCREIFKNTKKMLKQSDPEIIIQATGYTKWDTSEQLYNTFLRYRATGCLLAYDFVRLIFYKFKKMRGV